MSDPAPAPHDQDEVASLVTRCILAFEQGGDPAVDRVLETHPGLAGAAREQLGALRDAGLLVPPMPDPETLGPYRVLRRLGTGGVGSVYLAEQTEPVARKVAIKVIRPGMDSREVLARFAVERQALALLDHPNVARVLDAGTTPDGRPYLCMDYVPGQPITRYCDERRASIAERVELLAQVCEAVQSAHQKGILHRDLKPSNILVSDIGGRPRPTVIDFGVAKSLGPRLLDVTLLTGYGRFVGTLEYASPEQAANEVDVDTRTDVYALGVVLYELLSGCLPFSSERLRAADTTEFVRILREETPPVPSVASAMREGSADRARRRDATPAALVRTLQGELDWIVQKALEKDRSRRYGMAADLAADLRAYGRGEAVRAGPPNAWYRWRKLLARHRIEVGSAAAVLFALVMGLVTSLVFWTDAVAKSAESDASLEIALEAVERMVRAGEDRLDVVPRMEEVRRELLGEALELHRRLAATAGEGRVRVRTVRALSGLANVRAQLGDTAQAMLSADEALALIGRLPAQSRNDPAVERLRIELIHSQALWTRSLNRPRGESDRKLEVARNAAATLLTRVEPEPAFRRLAASIFANHAETIAGADRERAAAEFERSAELLEPLLRPPHGDVVELAQVLATRSRHAAFLVESGERERAVELAGQLTATARAEFERDDDLIHRARLLPAIVGLATIWYRCEEHERCIAELEPAIAVRRDLVRDFPKVPGHREGLGVALIDCALSEERLGRLDAAMTRQREALELFEGLVTDHPESPRYRERLLQNAMNIANGVVSRARYGGEPDWQRADAAIDKGVAMASWLDGGADPSPRTLELLAEFDRIRGLVYARRGWHEKAVAAERDSERRYRELCERRPDAPLIASRLVDTRQLLAESLLATGRDGEAARFVTSAMALLDEITPALPSSERARSTQRDLVSLQVRIAVARAAFDEVLPGIDRYVELSPDPEVDWVGRNHAAALVFAAFEAASADGEWRDRFAARVRDEVRAGLTYGESLAPTPMVAVMRSRSLARLVELERARGDATAAAAAQAEVVAGYVAALEARASERSRARVRSAYELLAELRRAAGDGAGAAAAERELSELLAR